MNSGLTRGSAKITVSFPYGLCPINRPKPLHSLRSRVTASLFAHKCAISLTLECLLERMFVKKILFVKYLTYCEQSELTKRVSSRLIYNRVFTLQPTTDDLLD